MKSVALAAFLLSALIAESQSLGLVRNSGDIAALWTSTHLASLIDGGGGPAGPGSNHGLNLTWTETSCASGAQCTYKIYRGTSAGGENYSNPVGTTGLGVMSYLDQSGTAGTTYYYTVTAVWNLIEGSPSNEGSGTYPFVPSAPALNPTVAPQ